jgi:phosphoglycolate phosphatase
MKDIHNYTKVLPGIKELLVELKVHGIKTAVVTTDSINNTNEIIQYLGLGSYFDILIGKEATKEPKISGKPALLALEALKIDPRQAVCVGDAPMDILMARNSGCKAGIGVALGQIKYEDLAKETDYVIKSYGELKICSSKS